MKLDVWTVIGVAGQMLFFFRFFYQWIASEIAKRSDIVFILGQGSGLFIYSRNIFLIRRERRRAS